MNPARRTRRPLPLLLAALLGLALPATATDEPSAAELLEQVRAAYAGLDAYRDFGEIERVDGGNEPVHYFETAATAGGGFLWRAVTDGRHERVVWRREDGERFAYDQGRRQFKPVVSLVGELDGWFGAGASAALPVPLLLAGAGGALPPPGAATVEGEEACGGRRCWVIAAAGASMGPLEVRLWIDREDSLIRRTEVRVQALAAARKAGKEPVTLRVGYEVREVEEPVPPSQLTFRPPAIARQVDFWGVVEEDDEPVESADGSDAEALAEALNLGYVEVVDVALKEVVVRIVDRRGKPIRGLRPEELVATVGDRDVPVVGLDWHSSAGPAEPAVPEPPAVAERRERPETTPELPIFADVPRQPPPGELDRLDELQDGGKLVVIFVQIGHHMVVSFDESYISGHLKLLPHLRKLLDDLPPGDRVAVVSFDSRLKVWLDFTADRDAVAEVVYRAIGFGEPEKVRRSAGVSLLDHLDLDAARDVANPEEALRQTAEALEPLPGIKEVIFAGWALGRYIQGVGVVMPEEFGRAVRALGRADATVFALDVVQADGHQLASGLKSVAAATGGTYASLYDAVPRKVAELARTLSGYYVVTLDANAIPDAGGALEIRLRDRPGQLLHRPIVFGARPSG